HYFMGPVHGAIVNWFGHWLGYRNFDEKDASRNTLPFDFVTLGELFQNNHHHYGSRPRFGVRWFEIDPAWFAISLLHKLGIIRLRGTSAAPAALPVETEPAVDALPSAAGGSRWGASTLVALVPIKHRHIRDIHTIANRAGRASGP